MKSLQIHCEGGAPYDLLIGTGVRRELATRASLDHYSSIFVLTESIIEEKWISSLPKSLQEAKRHVVSAGEGSKCISTCEDVWSFLLSHGADRRSLLVNIGGGMVTDLGGFSASTFMRGIPFINVPTTLLAQVDASIGGKTGVNFGGVKNIVGTFTQPKAVVIDVEILDTLPDREFIAGLAEVVKHGLIYDSNYFHSTVALASDGRLSGVALEETISRSCEIKRDVVNADERESGIRKLLNFGHTFGHAFESISLKKGEPLLHGEAVSIGMVAEAFLALELGLLKQEEVQALKDGLQAVGLPTQLKLSCSFDDVYPLLEHDKKNTRGKISWTLLDAIGSGVVDQSAEKALVERSFQAILQE